jgi:hypothetical protein
MGKHLSFHESKTHERDLSLLKKTSLTVMPPQPEVFVWITEAILEILGGSDTPNGDSSAGQLLSAKQLQKRLSSSATFFDTSPPSPVIFGLKRPTRETIPVQSRTPPFPGIGIAGDRNATALQPIIQSDSPRTIGRPWPNRGRPERERSRCFGNTPPSRLSKRMPFLAVARE